MKQICKLFLCCFFISISAISQNTIDCDFNFRQAVTHLKGSTYVEKDSLKAIEFLKPCVALENPKAQLLMARLYLNSNEDSNFKKGFKLTKKAAKQDYALAAHDLGVLYKYGKGDKLNLKKSVKWFKKSHELGNSKAAYSLGYMHFKGFGGLEQNYEKAIKWFKKTEYPMAKHWLAVSYYFGYGLAQNKEKAMQFLKENSIENSEILISSLENLSQESKLEEDEVYLMNELTKVENNSVINEEIEINDLIGKWAGSLIQFDWSKSKITQKVPVSLIFLKDSVLDDISYDLLIDDKQVNGAVTYLGNSLYFEGLMLNLEHPYSSNTQKNLDYNIISNTLMASNYKEDKYLLISTESIIEDWKEQGAPMVFVLRKEKVLTENNVEISNEALEALEAQNSFIKLYPNPFESDLIIAYELDKPSSVSVKLTSIDGSYTRMIKSGNQQNTGVYRYHFNGSSLKNGLYVISIMVDGSQKTKMIIKQ